MKMQVKPLLWVTDPWDTLSVEQDTTIRLMQEAVMLGIPTYFSSSDQILSQPDGLNVVLLPPSQQIKTPNNWQTIACDIPFQIHYRVDPPVDFNYRNLIEKLQQRGVSPTQIVNPPHILLNQSEKLPPPALHADCPLGIVCRTRDDIAPVVQTVATFPNSFAVIKPLNQAQSKGVVRVKQPSAQEWVHLLEQHTQNFSEPVLVQEYLPGIDQGEIRIWYSCGRILAALKKFPKSGDFRVLIDEGSRIAAHTLTSKEEQIALRIGETLKQQGVKLAAIDLIDDKISDYNITSPGLLKQLEQVHGGKNFARQVVEDLMTSK